MSLNSDAKLTGVPSLASVFGWLAAACLMPTATAVAIDEPGWREPSGSEVVALRRVDSKGPTPAIAVATSGDLHVIWWEGGGFHEQKFGASGELASLRRRLTEPEERCSGAAQARHLRDNELVMAWQCTVGKRRSRVDAVLHDTDDGTSLGVMLVVDELEGLLADSVGLGTGAGGHFVVTWTNSSGPSWARLYSPRGTPIGSPVFLCGDCALGPPGVAIQDGGSPVFSWTEADTVWLSVSRQNASGSHAAEALSSRRHEVLTASDLVSTHSGNVAAAWIGRSKDGGYPQVLVRQAAVEGRPDPSEVAVFNSSDALSLVFERPRLAMSPQHDSLVVLWSAWHRDLNDAKREIGVFAQRMHPASLEPLGLPLRVSSPVRPATGLQLGFDRSGRFLVAGLRPTEDAQTDEIWIRWIEPSDWNGTAPEAPDPSARTDAGD